MDTMPPEEQHVAESGSRGCAVRLAFYIALAGASLVLGAAVGAGIAHFDQDLALVQWLSEHGIDVPSYSR